jgi:hypothetical protein
VVRVSQLVGGVVRGGHGGKGDEVWRGRSPNVAVETTGAARGFTQGANRRQSGSRAGGNGEVRGEAKCAELRGWEVLTIGLFPIAVLLRFLAQGCCGTC